MRSAVNTALVMLQRALRTFDARSLPPLIRVAPIALLTAVLAFSPAALAAAPPTVSATIGTGYAKRTLALCGDRDPSPYTYFHRGAPILIQGAVRPRPPARPWYVTIRRKHCVGKKFEGNLGDITIRGRPDGTFRTVYTARLTGVFTVRILHDVPNMPGVRIVSATYHLIVR
jgi:hypothetical protein